MWKIIIKWSKIRSTKAYTLHEDMENMPKRQKEHLIMGFPNDLIDFWKHKNVAKKNCPPWTLTLYIALGTRTQLSGACRAYNGFN
jgi:hypothetical protein